MCLLVCACVAASAAAAATPTKSSWAAGANRICRLELTRLHALPKPAQGDVTGTVAYLQRVVAITNPLTRQIAALPRPAAEATPIRQWLATQWSAAGMAGRLSDAVTAGDSAGVSLVVRQITALGVRADALARRLGAAVCAES